MIQIEKDYLDFIMSDDYCLKNDYFLQYTFDELCFDKCITISGISRISSDMGLVITIALMYNNIKILSFAKFIVDIREKSAKFSDDISSLDIILLLTDFYKINHVEKETIIKNILKSADYKNIILTHKIRNEDNYYMI